MFPQEQYKHNDNFKSLRLTLVNISLIASIT